MSNAYIEGHVKTRKPGRRYSRANGRRTANLSIHNYVYNSIPADWPVAAGDCVEWIDAHGEILQGTVRGAKNINGVPHVTVKMAGDKVKPAALDAIKRVVTDTGVQELPISLIRRDEGTQTRVSTEGDVVNEYAEDMRDGQEFPPIEVYFDGAKYFLADGFHRVAAAEQIGRETILAEVKPGTRRDALFAALAANQKRGLHRKNIDKQFAARQMLSDPEWREWSNRAIADHIGVSDKFVAGIRRKLFPTNNANGSQSLSNPLTRGRDNRLYDTSNLSNPAPAPDVPTTPEERVKPALPFGTPNVLKVAVDAGTVAHATALEMVTLLKWFPAEDADQVAYLCMNSIEKMRILLRLRQSADYVGSNETYLEIIRTGKFHYGDTLEKVCDFIRAGIEDIHRALKSLADHHKRIASDTKRQELAERAQSAVLPDRALLVCADFREYMADMPENSVDLIFTDPPYDQESVPLYGEMARLAARVLKPGGSLIAYAGHYAIPEITALMGEHLRYWWMLGVKHSGGNARLPGKFVFVEYKPLLWYVKEQRGNREYIRDLFTSETPEKEYHDWAQSTSEASYYIQRLTQRGDTILDPFMGSGTTLIAALQNDCKAIGIEIDQQRCAVAKGRIYEHS